MLQGKRDAETIAALQKQLADARASPVKEPPPVPVNAVAEEQLRRRVAELEVQLAEEQRQRQALATLRRQVPAVAPPIAWTRPRGVSLTPRSPSFPDGLCCEAGRRDSASGVCPHACDLARQGRLAVPATAPAAHSAPAAAA